MLWTLRFIIWIFKQIKMIKEIIGKTIVGVISSVLIFITIISLIYLALKFGVPYIIQNITPDWMKEVQKVIP